MIYLFNINKTRHSYQLTISKLKTITTSIRLCSRALSLSHNHLQSLWKWHLRHQSCESTMTMMKLESLKGSSSWKDTKQTKWNSSETDLSRLVNTNKHEKELEMNDVVTISQKFSQSSNFYLYKEFCYILTVEWRMSSLSPGNCITSIRQKPAPLWLSWTKGVCSVWPSLWSWKIHISFTVRIFCRWNFSHCLSQDSVYIFWRTLNLQVS